MSFPGRDTAPQQWLFRRNCALSPAQLAACFAVVGLVSLLIAAVFASQGAWPVLLFSGVEVLALVAAFFVYGRHAADYERIEVDPQRLTVETMSGNRIRRRELPLNWLRIEYGDQSRGLIRLVRGTESLLVGGLVAQDERSRLATELRSTLARLERGEGRTQGAWRPAETPVTNSN